MNHIHKTVIGFFILMIVVTIILILSETGNYYLASLQERPHHNAHKLWKPGGVNGHGLGIAGSLMITILFTYSFRKRVRFAQKWGKLRTWLNYHIFLGISGPILVTFHTALKFGGLVSVSYWSMIAVASSGFIGRYIYIKIPRSVSGKEVTSGEFKRQLQVITEKFKKEFDISDEIIEKIRKLSGAEKIEKRGMLGIFTIFYMDITGWFKWQAIKNEIKKASTISREEMKQFKHYLRQIVKMDRQIAFWNAAQSLFHYWHVIHRPFAYTMIVIMIIHITLAISFGFTWIF